MDYEKKCKNMVLIEQNAILQELKALYSRIECQTVCNDAGGNRIWCRVRQRVNEAITTIQEDYEYSTKSKSI